MSDERITGVGILSEKHGLIALPKPCRHHCLYSLAAFLGIDPLPDDAGGFVTSKGRYLTREEAAKFVGHSSDTLYSEDLW